MSLQTERSAIEAYFIANWTATAYGLDGHPFTPSADSVRLTITSGAVMQGSIGRTANVYNNVGMVTFQIFTDGALGSSAWRGYAETLEELFRAKTLYANGTLSPASPSDPAFVRFSPPELGDNRHPYMGGISKDAPFQIANVICPFIRYETR